MQSMRNRFSTRQKMRRISLIGVSFCLCKNCYAEFIEKIEEELAEE